MEDRTHEREPDNAQGSEDQKPQEQDYEGGEGATTSDPPSTDPGDVPGPGKGP